MQHFVYPASLTPEEQDGGYVVTFPDLPEAISQGDDTLDALRQGADCLEEAIAGRIRRLGPSFYAIPLSAQMAAKAALYLALCQAGITQVELASRLHCDEKEVRRLLDPRHASKLSRLESALAALGQQLVVGMQATV
jgi:antitoxin HicB